MSSAVRTPRRSKGNQPGLSRFEVLGRTTDRTLIRAIAKRLATGDAESARIRTTIRETISSESSRKCGILAALRQSPLVGANLQIKRSPVRSRKVHRSLEFDQTRHKPILVKKP